MELGLEHFAAYLEHKVKFTDGLGIYELDAENLAGVINDCKHLNNIKLHLRPLSDLTKEITVNGETFVPIDVLRKDYPGFWFEFTDSLIFKSKNTNLYISINWIGEINTKLLEWHFDIFGLIPAVLAIDRNTLNK